MENYTVLIVDDEESVIQVIMKKIEWNKLGFTVIGHANNGVKGLEMAQEFEPDVVMTDIKMPYLDGMEMSREIKKNNPDTKLIIFTGFDEFEYAKEAIHLEVEEYLLKPINSIELTQVMQKTKEKLDAERDERRNIAVLKEYYQQSLPLLRENFFASLVQGKLTSLEIEKYLVDYQVSLHSNFYCCAIIHTSEVDTSGQLDRVLLNTSIHKQIKDRLPGKWEVLYFSYLDNLNVIVKLQDKQDIIEFTDDCNRLCKYILKKNSAVITIGIGRVCDSLSSLVDSYTSAKKAVSYRVLYGASQAININEIIPEESIRGENIESTELATIFKTIYFSSKEEIYRAVDQYLKQVLFPQKSLQKYQITMMELISAIYRFIWNNGIQVNEFLDTMGDLYGKLSEMSHDALRNWLVTMSYTLREKLIEKRNTNRKSYVTNAIEYIHNNYADENLSLDTVCKVLSVSNSYFSMVFKKETSKSFIEYLTDYRMEKASTYLLETEEKSYVIAKKVGYVDANYFSYVFKKRFGVSPSKYRMEYLHGKE